MRQPKDRKRYRVPGWAVWAVLVAWAVPAAPVALGQRVPLTARPAGKSVQVRRPVLAQSAAPVALDPDTEYRLKLAWLADPITYPLRLQVQPAAGGLRVSGFVPNPVIKQRVLDMANAVTGVPIQDGLRVVPGMVGGGGGPVSAAELEREAVEVVATAAPRLADQLRVSVDAGGKVTLSGGVGTLQEQWAVCDALRRLNHCRCVALQVEAGYGVPAGRPESALPLVEADTGLRQVSFGPAGEPPVAEAPSPRPLPVGPGPFSTPAPGADVDEPADLPSYLPSLADLPSAGELTTAGHTATEPVPAPSAPAFAPPAPAAGVRTAAETRAVAPAPKAVQWQPVPETDLPPPVPAARPEPKPFAPAVARARPEQPQKAVDARSWAAVDLSANKLDPRQAATAAGGTAPGGNAWAKVELPSRVAGAMTTTRAGTAGGAPPPARAGSGRPAARPLGSPYQAVAVVTWVSSPESSPGVRQVSAPVVSAAPASPIPVVTDDPTPSPVPAAARTATPTPLPAPKAVVARAEPPAPARVESPTAEVTGDQGATLPGRPANPQYRKLVEAACAGKATDVVVRAKDDGKLFIYLEVPNEPTGAELFQRINAIPELGPFAIEFKARVRQ